MTETRIRLLCRMDDAGSCRSANEAIAEVLRDGYARNVSVMACGPTFDAAAEMLREFPDACIGLHATINAEWDRVKWPPVLPAKRVRSLVDDAGMLLASPQANHDRGVSPEQILAEVAAQLARMRSAGLDVVYVDEHMAFGWLAGVGEALAKWATREGLIRGHGRLDRLPDVERPIDDVGEELVARLAAAGAGDYLLVGHPGYDRADMRRFAHAGLAPGQVAKERVRQRLQFLSPATAEYARDHGVAFVRYDDVLTPGA